MRQLNTISKTIAVISVTVLNSAINYIYPTAKKEVSMMKHEAITVYCKQKSEESAKAHIERITKFNASRLIDSGVGHDEKRGWHSWMTVKQWVEPKENE
jgi:hypothetical protein